MPDTIHINDHGPHVKRVQRGVNRRLVSRSAASHSCAEDGVWGPRSRQALVKASYLLGMGREELEGVKHGGIGPAEQEFILHPGSRSDREKESGQRRVKRHRAAVRKRREERARASSKRKRVVAEAEKAAANYRKNPWAYHYLAGGIANTEYLRPTPRNWRSDCSQFVAAVYRGAGLPSPAQPLPHQWASTYSIVKANGARFVDRAHRKPGMLGMYGSRWAPHHVELWCGDKFIGHGTQPIDSLTPGEPDYYIDFDFLN